MAGALPNLGDSKGPSTDATTARAWMPGMGSLLVIAGLVLLGVALFLVLATPHAEATHFRAGTMQWHYTSTVPDPGLGLPPILPSVNLTMEVAFRRSYPAFLCSPSCNIGSLIGNVGDIYWGDAQSTSAYDARVTNMDLDLDMIYVKFYATGTTQDLRHVYPSGSAGPYIAYWTSCCRLSSSGGHKNNPDQSWRLQTVVELSADNHSPVAILVPIRPCPESGTCTFQIDASDEDGDPMAFRLSTGSEATGGSFYQPGPCGGPCGTPASATINVATGVVTWVTTGASLGYPHTYYSMQIMVDDGHAIIPLDYFIRLDPPGPPPQCSPATQQAYTGQSVQYNSTGDGNTWSSPGGNPSAGSGNSHNTTYSRPGTYNATVSNSGGSTTCTVTVMDPNVPAPTPPKCDPNTQTVYIDQLASLQASDGNGLYSWSAPAGTPSTSGAPTTGNPNRVFQTSYPNAGGYSVKVTSGGRSGTCTVNVVPYPAPVCSPASQQVTIHGTANLAASGGNGAVYEWTTNGGAPSGSGSTYTPSFHSVGTFSVRLMSAGQTTRCTVIVKGYGTVSSGFTSESDGSGGNGSGFSSSTACGPRTVSFLDSSRSPNGPIVAWAWEFGDGGSSTDQNPSHVYRESGTYVATLRVTDSVGMTATKSTSVPVDVKPCSQAPSAPEEQGPDGSSPRDGANGDVAKVDSDEDGALDGQDNCEWVPNASQSDVDLDGVGDACDSDMDGDGVANTVDSCIADANPDQSDVDHDGLGDVCDSDMDNDGVANASDVCPGVADLDQTDTNADGVGDACQFQKGTLAAGGKQGASLSRGDAAALAAPASVAAAAPPMFLFGAVAILALASVIGIAAWRSGRRT